MRNPSPDLLDATFARILFESSLDGVVVVDGQGRTAEANAAALAMPFARIEPLLVERDTRDGELAAFHEQLAARGRATTEVRVTSSCGRVRVVAIEGRAMGARRLFLLRDVTTLRALQEEVHAVRRLESLGHFAATLAHDLNNVLTPIGCLSHMLIKDVGEDAPPAALARDVAGLAKSGGDLVRRVLAFARGEPTKPQAIELNAQIQGARPLLETLLGSSIRLTLSLDSVPASIVVDPVLLEHVLLNILANARDAIFERALRGTVTMRTANVLLGFTESEVPPGLSRGHYVMLTVTDDGAGMAAEVSERALEPFYSTKGARNGLGLGLANARRFAVESGGSLSVRSEAGEGTTVTMYLPRGE